MSSSRPTLSIPDFLKCEQKVQEIAELQAAHGVKLDVPACHRRIKELKEDIYNIDKDLKPLLPKRKVAGTPLKSAYLKNKVDFTNALKQWIEFGGEYEINEDNTVNRWKHVDIDVDSISQLKQFLLDIGWEPQYFNYKKDKDEFGKLRFAKGPDNKLVPLSPKLPKSDEELEELERKYDNLAFKMIVRRLQKKHRLGSIEGYLKRVRPDGQIESRVMTCGTNTARMTHIGVANVPRVSSYYGKEMRSLFTVPQGRSMVGADASRLEFRCLAHYINDYIFTDFVAEHDIKKYFLDILKDYVSNGDVAKACVPLDTQILTKEGFKTHDEVEIGELVLAYDQETKTKRWTPLLAKTYIEDQEVIELKNNSWVMQATRDHRWFVRQRRYANKSWSKVNGRYLDEQIRTTDDINTESNIIINAPMHPEEDLINSEHTLNPKKYGGNWSERVMNMSQKERLAFLEGFMIADGYNKDGIWNWSQLKGEFSEAAMLASYLVTDSSVNMTEIPGRMIRAILNQKSHITGQRLVKTSKGKQKVWCPTTKYGSWVMRQKDVITITGNCMYAMIYGGGNKKLGTMADIASGDPTTLGKEMRYKLESSIPNLDKLVKWCMKMHKEYKGIPAIDGRKIWTRSEHSALNTLLQSTGAIAMKYAACFTHHEFKRLGLDAHIIIQYHDEMQVDCIEGIEEQVGKILCDSMTKAGEHLNFNLPLTGEYASGKTWAETH